MTPPFPTPRLCDLVPVVPVGRSTGIAQRFGGAEAMLEIVEAESTKKPIVTTTYKTRAESGVVLHDLGRVAAELDTARMLLMAAVGTLDRSEEHTSELQSLMRISYAVFCLKKKNHVLRAVEYMYELQSQMLITVTIQSTTLKLAAA